MSSDAINFDGLLQVIQQTHSSFASQASKAPETAARPATSTGTGG